MRRVFNTLDYQLMDHGDRVAYIVLQLYKCDNTLSNEQLSKICYLSMFHDIGAYQTEPLDSLTDKTSHFSFELKNTLPHSVYSYLFFQEYPCFQDYAHGLLYHHFPYQKLLKSDCRNKEFAGRIFLAEKLDLLITRTPNITPEKILERLNNPTICQDDIAILAKLEEKDGTLQKAIKGSYHKELMSYLAMLEKEDELEAFIHILPHSIDFKSEHTVTHTIATVEIATTLARLFGFNTFELQQMYYGSLLHDIGKVAVSTLVLEKDGALTDEEYKYMKEHVVLSEHILRDCVSDDVYKIAVRHHEKLNGQGYPNGLKGEDLSVGERIVAVADVMSALLGRRSYKNPFPKEKVVGILEKLRDTDQLCPEAVNMALEHYDIIDLMVQKCSDVALKRYEKMNEEAQALIHSLTE